MVNEKATKTSTGKAIKKPTKRIFIEEALRVASRDGFEALTIGTLAARLGVSKSGLFGHFGSKENLQVEIVEHATAQFQEKVIAPAHGLRGRDKLVTYVRNWLEWADWDALPGGCPFVVGSIELDHRDGPVIERLRRLQLRWKGLLVQTVEEERGAAFREEVDAEAVVFEVFALYLAHHYYKRVFQSEEAKALTLGAFEKLLERLERV